MLSFRLLAGVCLGSVLFLGGCATQAPEPVTPEKVSIPEFRLYLADLREAVDEGVPRAFNEKDMREFNQINMRLLSLIDGRSSIEEMSSEERLALYNAQQELQSILIGKRENQVICRQRHTVGTNFKKTQCFTRREWDLMSRESSEFVRQRHVAPVVHPDERGRP